MAADESTDGHNGDVVNPHTSQQDQDNTIQTQRAPSTSNTVEGQQIPMVPELIEHSNRGNIVNMVSKTESHETELFDFSVGDTKLQTKAENSKELVLELMDELSKAEFDLKLLGRRAKTDAEKEMLRNQIAFARCLEGRFITVCKKLCWPQM